MRPLSALCVPDRHHQVFPAQHLQRVEQYLECQYGRAFYAAVCGITEEEMLERMLGHIECLAGALEMTCEETRLKLKEKYDGYHFTWPSPDIYNPFSLLNALERKKIDNYWFGSGTPTYLVEMLRKFHVLPSEVGHSMQAMASDFDAPTEKNGEHRASALSERIPHYKGI